VEGTSEVGARLADELLANATLSLKDNALALYMQETTLYRISNSVLRGTAREGDERLWPFISILQMALISARPKANDGGMIYRGGLITEAELDGRQRTVLRGFTSCSQSEMRAFEFACSRSRSRAPAQARIRVVHRSIDPAAPCRSA
jgi:hypothetical protein